MAGIGILLLLAAIVAACWKSEQYKLAPVRETRTIKGWVAALLFLLAIRCFAESSKEPSKAEKTQPRTVPVRFTGR